MQEKHAQSLDMVEKSCLAQGKRMTEPRRRVLACLLEAQSPLKAYDIIDEIGDIKPMSVYRSLEFLTDSGFAHRIESLNAYTPCVESHCEHKDSQYLICERCGQTEELHNHAIDDFIAKELSGNGFKLEHKVLELHGLCANCNI